jgi:predicted Zn-dependent protease
MGRTTLQLQAVRAPARSRIANRARALGVALALLPLGCAINPATGQPQLALIGEGEEVQLGRQNHQQVLSEMGAYPDSALQSYVASLGRELARRSERPNLPWTFTVVDDPAVNAFAIPGGYVYVTRGILAHMNSEAELAGVMGHEIGHVTARHSVEQMSRAELANLGLAVGTLVAPELQQMGPLLQQGVGLLFLKYSRDDESQADQLGVRYMTRDGYPASAMVEILSVLERVERAQGGPGVPDWLSTHPSPRDRVLRVRAEGQRNPVANPRSFDRNGFLAHLQGLPFGTNPREGYFDGDLFVQPDLGFQMELPRGWQHQNGKQAVQAASPDGQAGLQLTQPQAGSAQRAAERFFSNRALLPGPTRGFSSGAFAGLEVPFTAQSQGGGRVLGRALFVQDGPRVYQFLGFGTESGAQRYAPVVDRALASFGPVRDACLRSVQPSRIELVQATRGMTAADLTRGSGTDVQTVAILNHVDAGAALQAGQTYKRVVGGNSGCGRRSRF